MASGGARNRSGPPANPMSARSDRRKVSFKALPARGYDGPVPAWPLEISNDREIVVWEWAWCTPQAWAWAQPGMEWMYRSVAMWVRTSVRCEEPDAPASLLAQVHRFADQIGMTTAGLQALGWAIAPDELAARRAEKESADEGPREAPVRRMRG